MKTTYSYHIFYFPFKWEIQGMENEIFSEQINLDKINICEPSYWKRTQYSDNPDEQKQLYNEKNYYYKFVHNILYDEESNPLGLIHHYERQEPQQLDVYYLIKTTQRPSPYRLKVEAININLYATGVGFMSFYLRNEEESQNAPDDILFINQYGRRIMPPFFADIACRNETSEYIRIEGLLSGNSMEEDFKEYTPADSWKPACFITSLIEELSDNITVQPIIDDRMFVASWYKNDELANQFTNDASAFVRCHPTTSQVPFSVFWYKYLFVDNTSETCQNDGMKKELLKNHTYTRWQKWSSLYGVSRYSLVYLTNATVPDHLIASFQTIYARMVELVLVQRASMLRFSEEVTKVSKLSNVPVKALSERISSLYKEYIQFINQIYFREVSAQDQGIELYTMLHKCHAMDEYIKDLDSEIGELHQYVSLKEDRHRNKEAEILNILAALFLPATVVTGIFGMTAKFGERDFNYQLCILAGGTLLCWILLFIFILNKKKRL